MIHVMLDLETAGRAPDGAVIAIGAVAFTGSGVVSTFEALLDFESVVAQGGTIDPGTIKWWLEQDAAVRTRMFNGTELAPIALMRFSEWYKIVGAERVWANGTTFDIVILDSMYRRAGLKQPYAYRDVRDMRWLRDTVPPEFLQTIYAAHTQAAHSALDDAQVQAHVVRAVARHLGVAL